VPKPVKPQQIVPTKPALSAAKTNPGANSKLSINPIKKAPPALPSKGPVSKVPISRPNLNIDSEALLSDASKTESISDLGDTTEQESDWPEFNQTVKSLKPVAVTPKKPTGPKFPTSPSAVKPSEPIKPTVSRAKEETEDEQAVVTDYDDLTDTDLTLGETTEQESDHPQTNPVINRHESIRSDMTSESDWNFPTTATTIKPTTIKPTNISPKRNPSAGAFTKQPLPMKKPATKPTSSLVRTPTNPNFDQLKPKATSKAADDVFSDARGDDSDDASAFSDAVTTDNPDDYGFNV
jgi:hypothetical protein